MRILALDASTSNVGWCLAEDDRYINSGQYSPSDQGFDAVLDYYCWLDKTADYESVDAIFYERPSGSHGNNWTNTLLGALWYVTWDVARFQCELVVVSPAEVKKTGFSKGLLLNVDDLMRDWYELTGKTFDPNQNVAALQRFGDELDAVGIWLAGWRKLNEQKWRVLYTIHGLGRRAF